MNTPHNGNGSSAKHPLDDDDDFPFSEATLAAIGRDPAAAALALIQAIDRLLAECPLHPEPVGAPGTSACPLCGPGYQY